MKNTCAIFVSLTILRRGIGRESLDLWRSDAVEWHLVKRLPDYTPRPRKRKAVGEMVQASFPDIEMR
jgi:hypothetical protein